VVDTRITRGDNMGQNTTTATDADFASIVASDTPTLVDFWAEWCGPCKMMDVPLDELAGENAGKLTVAKLNVDQNPATMTAYSVMSIPTLIVFQNGEEKRRFVGARSKGQLQAELADYLS
jgi:thioredoxin 1